MPQHRRTAGQLSSGTRCDEMGHRTMSRLHLWAMKNTTYTFLALSHCNSKQCILKFTEQLWTLAFLRHSVRHLCCLTCVPCAKCG